MNNEEIICKKVATLFTGRVWNNLTKKEKEIVGDLIQTGWMEEKPNTVVLAVKKIK